MPHYHSSHRKNGRQNGDNGSFWISYSDLMSAIVLVFVLILFYCMYQYFDMLEVKTAELLRQSGLLDEQQAALTQSEQDLSSALARSIRSRASWTRRARSSTRRSRPLWPSRPSCCFRNRPSQHCRISSTSRKPSSPPSRASWTRPPASSRQPRRSWKHSRRSWTSWSACARSWSPALSAL